MRPGKIIHEIKQHNICRAAHSICLLARFLVLGHIANKLFDEKGQIIVIKNIPCLVCENCGEIYLTSETVLEIEKFLDSAALPEIEVINYEILKQN